MRPRELLDFFERHGGSPSPYIDEAHAAVRAGTCDSGFSPSTVPCTDLLPIYVVRAKHLESLGAAHAARLHGEVMILCAALKRAIGHAARLFHIPLRDGRTFTFFENTTTSELLGALASYDARALSEEEWLRVWGTSLAWSGRDPTQS